jgi:hypothetical protein
MTLLVVTPQPRAGKPEPTFACDIEYDSAMTHRAERDRS